MPFRHLRQSRTSKVVLFWLIPALLLSVGLRVCLHAYENPAHVTNASPIHIESALSALGDHDEGTADTDTPVAATTKLPTFEPHLGLLFVALLFVILSPVRKGFTPARNARPLLPLSPHLTPPGRAPPR